MGEEGDVFFFGGGVSFFFFNKYFFFVVCFVVCFFPRPLCIRWVFLKGFLVFCVVFVVLRSLKASRKHLLEGLGSSDFHVFFKDFVFRFFLLTHVFERFCK